MTTYSTQKILVIEDEKPIRNAITTKLKLEGFNVIEAENGEEGLRMALDEQPSLILLDIVMPVMDGIAVLKKLREDPWGVGANVIILTNLGDKIAEAYAVGGSLEHLIKSNWKIEDLVKKVKNKLS